jgi:hypothetical protein
MVMTSNFCGHDGKPIVKTKVLVVFPLCWSRHELKYVTVQKKRLKKMEHATLMAKLFILQSEGFFYAQNLGLRLDFFTGDYLQKVYVVNLTMVTIIHHLQVQ